MCSAPGRRKIAASGAAAYASIVAAATLAGIEFGIQPLISQATGAKRHRDLKFLMEMGLKITLIYGMAVWLLIAGLDPTDKAVRVAVVDIGTTMTRCASCAVMSRCAMATTVRPSRTAASDCSRCRAARGSSKDVASSSTKVWGSASTNRAKSVVVSARVRSLMPRDDNSANCCAAAAPSRSSAIVNEIFCACRSVITSSSPTCGGASGR